MKSLTSILISVAIVALSAGSATTSFAQAAASFQASATIVTPQSVEKLTDLEFTHMPVQNTAAQASANQAKISAIINRNHAAAADAGTVTAASFTVSGYANYVYGVTMPAQVTKSVGNRTVTIGTSVSAASASYTLSALGTDVFSIKGTLSVGTSASPAAKVVAAVNTDINDQDFVAFEEFPVTIIYN